MNIAYVSGCKFAPDDNVQPEFSQNGATVTMKGKTFRVAGKDYVLEDTDFDLISDPDQIVHVIGYLVTDASGVPSLVVDEILTNTHRPMDLSKTPYTQVATLFHADVPKACEDLTSITLVIHQSVPEAGVSNG